MATLSPALPHGADQKIPRSKRKLQKHLRSAGLAYISRTGKLIPAKQVADELCQCPQKCDDKIPLEIRNRLFSHFYCMGDADRQNQFLRDHMDVRARSNVLEMANANGNGNANANATRPPKRITCKYLIPFIPSTNTVEVCQKAFVSAFVITTKRVRLQREKLIASMGLNNYGHTRPPTTKPSPMETNNNNHINYSLTIPVNALLQQQKPHQCDSSENPDVQTTVPNSHKQNGASGLSMNDKDAADNPLIPFGLLLPEGITIVPVTATPDHDRDIAIVNNFFYNQLWKPEYIGTYS